MTKSLITKEKLPSEVNHKNSIGAKILFFISGVALLILITSLFIGPVIQWYIPIIVWMILAVFWLLIVIFTPVVSILITNKHKSKKILIASLIVDLFISLLATFSSIYVVFRFLSSHYVTAYLPINVINFFTENQLIVQFLIIIGILILALLAYPLIFSIISYLEVKHTLILKQEKKKTIAILAIASALWVFVPLLPVYLDNILHVDLLFILLLALLYIILTLITYFITLTISKSAFVSFCICVIGWAGLSLSYFVVKNLMQDFILAPELYALGLILIMIGAGYAINKLIVHLKLPTDKIAKWLLLLVIVLIAINCVPLIISGNESASTYEDNAKSQNLVINSSLPHPNIYWIHAESMVDTTVLEKYWGVDKVNISSLLSEKGFFVNHEAYLKGYPYTSVEVASLVNPDFYDANKDAYYVSHLSKSVPGSLGAISNNPLINGFKSINYSSNFVASAGGIANVPFKTDNIYLFSALNTHKLSSDELANPIVKTIYTNIDNEYDFISYDAYIIYSIIKSIYLREKLQYFYENTKLDLQKDIHLASANEIINQWIPSSDWRDIDGYNNEIVATITAINQTEKPSLLYLCSALAHYWYSIDENGTVYPLSENIKDYYGQYLFSEKLIMAIVEIIQKSDPNGIIIIQGDHGFSGWSATNDKEKFLAEFGEDVDIGELQNHVLSAIYIPKEYRTSNYSNILKNPRNIARYLINNYVGQNYEYLPTKNYT